MSQAAMRMKVKSASKPPFKKGDSIKVKDGVMCPGYKKLCLAGWQGRIIAIDQTDQGKPLVDIAWDSLTLKAIPLAYIENSEEKGLDWTRMCLLAGEVEPAQPRDSEQEARQVSQEMERRYSWLGDGEEGRRIYAIIGELDPDDDMYMFEVWKKHLEKVLQFPFTAEVSEYQDHPPPNQGDKLEVTQFAEADDLFGVLVESRYGRNKIVFPLSDLTVVKKKKPNYQPVQDYCVWFANK